MFTIYLTWQISLNITSMEIHANHFSYDTTNSNKPSFNILMIYLANDFNPDFEKNLPEWPKDEVSKQKITISSKCYFDINSLNNFVNFDLIILAIECINQIEVQEIDALLLALQPKKTMLLYQGKNIYLKLESINSYITCDYNLLNGMFALGWYTATLCLYSDQLIAFDFIDFAEAVFQFKHGILYLAELNTQASDYESLAQAAVNYWQVEGVDTTAIAGLFCATSIKFNNSNFRMADYIKVISLYHSRFRELSVYPSHVFGVSVPESSYHAYPFIQLTMIGTVNQIEANFSSHSILENLKINNIQSSYLPAFLRKNIS